MATQPGTAPLVGEFASEPAADGSANFDQRAPGWRRRLLGAARFAAPAVLAYAAVRLASLGVLWWWSTAVGRDPLHYLNRRYDAGWYVGVVTRGYDTAIPIGANGEPEHSNLAFFPLYPGLIRVVGAVLPVSYPTAGLLISTLASLVAAWGIFLIGNRLAGRRAGIILAVLWGLLPHAIVESMAYTETVLTALAAWSLYAVLTERWITAGVLCVLAGLTRPTGLALVAAVGLGACWALWLRRGGWRPVAAMLIAPLGWLAYVAWVGWRLGRVDGYFEVQAAWGSSFDGGRYTVHRLLAVLTERGQPVVVYVVSLVLAASVLLVVIAHRQPLPLVVYSVSLVVLAVGSAGYYHSKARYLLPAFTLLLPVAMAIARARTRTMIATLTLVGAVSAWFGGYLALVWHASP